MHAHSTLCCLLQGGTAETLVGSRPVSADNTNTYTVGYQQPIESAIWSLTGDQLTAQWVNTDGSKSANFVQYSQSILALTGDEAEFQGSYGGVTVKLAFVQA